MTNWSVSCRILRSAQEDLNTVMQALVAADVEKLENSKKLLERMVVTMGVIEAAARQQDSSVTRADLVAFQKELKRVGTLNRAALTTVERQGGLEALSCTTGGTLEFAA